MSIRQFTLFLIITGLLYTIGYIFTIPLFMLQYEYINDTNDTYGTTGSILPLLIGVIVTHIAEKTRRTFNSSNKTSYK
ncbi:hypothetical protein [Metabacillus fastidiosus]|uniref:hypothetical protein n=1 Tax=Metabacillus fastidiosus TaxID=1458 RepID=UPI002DB7B233|nr:hypothetical protein [Metabacillus fastidiosus]MEC2077671.1 hypothetical protein [Metabacillus fastidiosus]